MSSALYDPVKGFTDRVALEALKLEKLKKQIAHICERSPYQRARFDKAGFRPEHLETLADLRHVPMMDKQLERESQAESQAKGISSLGMHIVCDPKDVIRISSTSGTTGIPTFTGYTDKDTLVSAEVMKRGMSLMGAQKGDVVMHGFVLSMWIAGVPVVDIMQRAGFTVVPIGGQSGPERFAVTARAVFPAQLNCTPSFAVWMADKLKQELGIDPKEFGFKRLMVAGEPGGSIPAVREKISNLWGGVEIYDVIGAIHSTFMSSCSCQHNSGMHFLAEDFAHLEILDPATGESLPLEDGVTGEAVYTALEKECAPAVRFRTGDKYLVRRGACACGRDTLRFVIDGRVDDMLLVRGVNVFPSAIQAIVARYSGRGVGSNIRVVLKSKPPVQEPPLPVRVELVEEIVGEAKAALEAEMSEVISNELRFRCQVELLTPGSLAAFQKDKNQKQQIFDREYAS
jgi:phenylacetate-CoA ligase